MRKFIQNKLKDQKGLTLIELLAVIVILAIIAAIAIPAIGNIIENSRHNAVKADLQNVLNSSNLYFTENNSADGATADKTALEPYVEDFGSIQTVTVTKASTGNTITATATAPNGTKYNFDTAVTNTTLSGWKVANVKAKVVTGP